MAPFAEPLFRVAILGANLVGLATAALLARAGAHVTVFDDGPIDGDAQHLSARERSFEHGIGMTCGIDHLEAFYDLLDQNIYDHLRIHPLTYTTSYVFEDGHRYANSWEVADAIRSLESQCEGSSEGLFSYLREAKAQYTDAVAQSFFSTLPPSQAADAASLATRIAQISPSSRVTAPVFFSAWLGNCDTAAATDSFAWIHHLAVGQQLRSIEEGHIGLLESFAMLARMDGAQLRPLTPLQAIRTATPAPTATSLRACAIELQNGEILEVDQVIHCGDLAQAQEQLLAAPLPATDPQATADGLSYVQMRLWCSEVPDAIPEHGLLLPTTWPDLAQQLFAFTNPLAAQEFLLQQSHWPLHVRVHAHSSQRPSGVAATARLVTVHCPYPAVADAEIPEDIADIMMQQLSSYLQIPQASFMSRCLHFEFVSPEHVGKMLHTPYGKVLRPEQFFTGQKLQYLRGHGQLPIQNSLHLASNAVPWFYGAHSVMMAQLATKVLLRDFTPGPLQAPLEEGCLQHVHTGGLAPNIPVPAIP